MTTFTPSILQQNFFNVVQNPRGGNVILEAVAGSGKTTTIVQALKWMEGFVFLGAYNTKMGKELREKIAQVHPNKKSVRAGTFHSAGFSALKFALKKDYKENQITDKKVANIVDNLIRGREDLEGSASGIAGIVSMAKQRGFFTFINKNPTDNEWSEMVEHYALDSNLPENVRMDQIIAMAKVALRKSNEDLDTIDYNDMVYLPLFLNLRMLQNDWVLIDEAQDTNPTRRALAKKLLKPGGRLIAVGDPHQAIFGFTGADNDSLQQIADEFNCQRMPLDVSYRCPKAVVEHARKWVSHINAHESAPEGEVRTIEYKDILTTAKPGDAILCRYNKYLVNLCFKFIRAGVPAKIEGRSIGEGLIALSKRWKVKQLDALVTKLKNYMEKEVEKALAKKQEQKADQIIDKVETLLVLIERAREQEIRTLEGLQELIRGMFADNVEDGHPKPVILCSCHRSKGLEWDNVFILDREKLMPSPLARQQWQMEQEINLIYVAVTRAKKMLVEVTGVFEEAKQYS